MTTMLERLEEQLREAVAHFWSERDKQAQRQGGKDRKKKDRGSRGAVTGGKHIDGFIRLIFNLLVEAGLSGATICCRARPVAEEAAGGRTQLPGWFRAEKDWDLLVVVKKCLIAAIEFKSQVGPSFGNNFNNRTEEALGNATDLWAAYREGAFKPSNRPWLGYFMLLEEAPNSTRPVRPVEPHFRVFEEFREASYAGRYELLLLKLLRERLYDGACLLLSPRATESASGYREPNAELSFQNFVTSLLAWVLVAAQTQPAEAALLPPVIDTGSD